MNKLKKIVVRPTGDAEDHMLFLDSMLDVIESYKIEKKMNNITSIILFEFKEEPRYKLEIDIKDTNMHDIKIMLAMLSGHYVQIK